MVLTSLWCEERATNISHWPEVSFASFTRLVQARKVGGEAVLKSEHVTKHIYGEKKGTKTIEETTLNTSG